MTPEMNWDMARGPDSEELGSFFQCSQYEDEYMAATFSITFPFTAASLIHENTGILQGEVQTLPGKYLFEAGYDIIPGDCKLLVPEQLDCFSGLNPKALSTNRFLRHEGDALDCPIRQ